MDFRGQPEIIVGVGGNRTRYPAGVYDSTWKEWTFGQLEWYRDNKNYYRLKQFAWGGFFVL